MPWCSWSVIEPLPAAFEENAAAFQSERRRVSEKRRRVSSRTPPRFYGFAALDAKNAVIMNVDHLNNILQKEEGLSRTLAMEFLSTPEPDTCMARMRVNHLNRQVFGFLSGGATLALCENLAGVGAMAIVKDKIAVGITVSGNHVRAVTEGDTVTALARLTHKGRTLHTWQVDVTNEAGELVSSVQVTNYIIAPHKDNKTGI